MSVPATIPRKRLVAILEGLGYEGPIGSSHDFMKRGSHKLHIGNEHGSRAGSGNVYFSVAKKALTRAGLSEEEALELLKAG